LPAVDKLESEVKASGKGRKAPAADEERGHAQSRSNARAKGRTTKNSRLRTPGLPGSGPGLPPTAQRLLDAARRLLARSGYNSLSVEAIGREAGENKALIRYYFGSKNGLLLALVDGLISDTLWQARQRLSALSSREDRARLVVETLEAILNDTESYRLLYDLLPRLLENPSMARQLAELYRAYRDLNTRALWGDRLEEAPVVVRDVAAMTIALTDGLAVQLLAEPGSVDVPSTLAAWRSFVESVLASTSGTDPERAETD
jgi:AcrR family transcriptional regulator